MTTPFSGLKMPAKDLFDLGEEVVWLNSAYLGARAKPVAEAAAAAVNRPLPEVTVSDFFEVGNRMRVLLASLVGGDPEGVALVPSASYGVATAAAALRVGDGHRVLMLEEQFPAMVYPWTERGAEPVFVKRPSDDEWTSAVLSSLDETISVVSAPACHWTDGTRVDLETVGGGGPIGGGSIGGGHFPESGNGALRCGDRPARLCGGGGVQMALGAPGNVISVGFSGESGRSAVGCQLDDPGRNR